MSAPNKFFSAPGICANCGKKVGLGQTHVEWTTPEEGQWMCHAPEGEVARMKLPLPVSKMNRLVDYLESAYGKGLVMVQEGDWMIFIQEQT